MSVDRVYCGTLMTSLEMAGVSLTVLHLNEQRRAWLGEDIFVLMIRTCSEFNMVMAKLEVRMIDLVMISTLYTHLFLT